ncbi:LAGLIDADG family homing endonuclease [Patescibacteria group bacterium]
MSLNNDYIVGLVDGEGSFTVYVRNPVQIDNRKRRVKIEPRFYIKLIEEDKYILYKLKQFFDCGNVYFQGDKRPNHKNCYRYEVANRKDILEKIIPFFKTYPLKFSSKARDFKIFCQIMEAIKRGEHLTEKGLLKLYKLKQKMH